VTSRSKIIIGPSNPHHCASCQGSTVGAMTTKLLEAATPQPNTLHSPWYTTLQ
jgi:hypothetical protein